MSRTDATRATGNEPPMKADGEDRSPGRSQSAAELRSVRWLVGLACVLALLFGAAGLVSAIVSRRIDAEVTMLRSNALPSLGTLGSARAALRRIDRASTSLAGVPSDPSAGLRELRAARTQLDGALVAYLELPAFREERERYLDVQRTLGVLDGALRDLTHEVSSPSPSPATMQALELRVDDAVEALDASLETLVELSGREASATAGRIAAARETAVRTGLGLDAAFLVLAVAAVGVAVRAARKSFRLAVEEERARELEQFAHRVAHDLLSPLSSLTYCVNTLKRRTAGDEGAAEAAGRAMACVQRAQRLVRGIFDFARSGARPDPGARASVAEALNGVLEDVISSADGEAIDVRVEAFDDITVACAPGVLSSLVGNLVSNAVKFTRESLERRILIRVDCEGRHAGRVRLEVEDTGPGVPPSIEARIFEPYERAPGISQPGLGLGLATVRRFAETHGGAAGYRPAPSAGAVFWIELPIRARDLAAPSQATETRLH